MSGEDCESEREGGAADGSLLLLLVSTLSDLGESGPESYQDSRYLECERWFGSRRPWDSSCERTCAYEYLFGMVSN